MRIRKTHEIPRTGPSTSFQCDEGNYFNKNSPELENQGNNEEKTDSMSHHQQSLFLEN